MDDPDGQGPGAVGPIRDEVERDVRGLFAALGASAFRARRWCCRHSVRSATGSRRGRGPHRWESRPVPLPGHLAHTARVDAAAVPKCSQSRRLGLDSRRTQGASVSGSQRIRAEHTSRTESNGRTRQPFPPIIKVSIFAKSLMLIDQLFNQARLISIVARVLLVRITHAQPPSQREAPVSFPSINLSLFIYIASNPDRTSTIQPPTPSLSHSG